MTSGLPPEADIVTTGRHVSKLPGSDLPPTDAARQARITQAQPTAPCLRQNSPSGRISLNVSGKSPLQARPVFSRQEGRIAIVTNAGGDAVDAAASARAESQGEFLVSDFPARGTNGAWPG